MKNILSTIFSLLIAVSLMAQTYNDPNAEVRNVKGYKGIKVATGIQLVLTQGNTEAVAVSAPNTEDRDKIKTVIENGILKIYFDNSVWKLMRGKTPKNLKAYVSIINVEWMGASSGASLKANGEIKSDKLDIRVSSGAVLEARVVAKSIDVSNSSGAVINLSGSAESIDIDGSSGSVFRAYDLVVNSCEAETSSGAVAQLTVNKEISGSASSGGHISFKGNGTIRSKSTSSGGYVGKSK